PSWTTITVGTLYNRIPDVIDMLTTPPSGPLPFDRYIVGTGATGAWTFHDNQIATWDSSISQWFYTLPILNQGVFATGTSTKYFYNGATWNAFTIINFVDIFALTPNTNYEWQVVNVDTDGAHCAPTPVSVFMTPP